MPKNPPDGMPRITPYLFYTDVGAALNWLEKTFGFARGGEIPGPDGAIMHAEMKFKDGVVMMGTPDDEQGTRSPGQLPGIHQSLYIYVDNVDEHYRHAKDAGAENISEPVDMFWGDRMYTVQDLEGHHWSFAQHTKDIAPEDMKPSFSWGVIIHNRPFLPFASGFSDSFGGSGDGGCGGPVRRGVICNFNGRHCAEQKLASG